MIDNGLWLLMIGLLSANQKNNGKDDDSAESESEDDEDLKNKMIFVYQSATMKRMYQRYAPHMVLLDATYKTTRYALPLFFLVVQTNVNFQVVAVLVLQEESIQMILEALSVDKRCNQMFLHVMPLLILMKEKSTHWKLSFQTLKYFYVTFTGSKHGIGGYLKSIMGSHTSR